MKNNLSILVVDDEPHNFEVIEGLLCDRGYDLNYASNGPDAIASLGKFFHPDLFLLDVMMPEMDGIELCCRLKAMPEYQAVPIIAITALTSKEDLARCLSAGADDFISKPVNGLELRARVQSMLRIKQQYDQLRGWSHVQNNTIALLERSLRELRGSMASTLSHELNTPLNGVLSSLWLLNSYLDDEDTDPEEIREFIDMGTQSARRLEKLTQRLLTYLYLELETHRVDDPASSDIELSLAKTPTSFIQDLATSKALLVDRMDSFTLELESENLAMMDKHLQWLVEELLDNAFKFSPAQAPVRLSAKAADGVLHLQISDRGRGMTEEQITKVGAFMQFERSRYEQQGLGLGLKIAQKVVQLYGGKLSLSSIYGEETTISIELPLA